MIPPERRSSVNQRLDLFRNLPETSRSTTACSGGVGNLRTYAAPNLGATLERRERGGGVWHMGEVSTCCPWCWISWIGGATIAWGGILYIGSQGGDQPPLQERRRRGRRPRRMGQDGPCAILPFPPNPNPRGGLPMRMGHKGPCGAAHPSLMGSPPGGPR